MVVRLPEGGGAGIFWGEVGGGAVDQADPGTGAVAFDDVDAAGVLVEAEHVVDGMVEHVAEQDAV